ncbi:hypothetical protein D3C86_1299330 [compost metagenome]
MAQRGEPCRQQHQLVAQQLHQIIGTAQTRSVVIQMPTYAFQCANLPKQLHLSTVELCLAFLGTNHGAGMGGQQLDHLIDPREVILGHGLRACGQQADDTHAGHRQQCFGDPGHGQQKRAIRLRHGQQPHHHRRITAEYKRLGTGVAQ